MSYCGAPTPQGFNEWMGCALFHDGLRLSVVALTGVIWATVLITVWLMRMTR